MFDLVGVFLSVIMGAPVGASMDVYSVSIPVFLWVFLWEQHFHWGFFRDKSGSSSTKEEKNKTGCFEAETRLWIEVIRCLQPINSAYPL